MLAAYAEELNPDSPLDGLRVGQRPEPEIPEGWAAVEVKAAALNRHDLWSLRGVGLTRDRLPMILGCDAAGLDESGNEVVVHAVIPSAGWMGDETLDSERSLLSERYQGTFTERVVVPRRNLVRKPRELSLEEAACLPTAWLTAYRMLFTQSGVAPGGTILVQGAGGGVSTALVAIGAAAGYRMWVTSRSANKRERIRTLGAADAFDTGARLPERVDAVMETVGEPTWAHSLKSLRSGGTVVVSGATAGGQAVTDLRRVFFLQERIVGSTMGTRDELERLLQFLVRTGVRPTIDRVLPLAKAAEGFAAMEQGDLFGKVVFTV
jgi:NADPH:quinone reductase-like Zn-dependent oxidoreductase